MMCILFVSCFLLTLYVLLVSAWTLVSRELLFWEYVTFELFDMFRLYISLNVSSLHVL